MYKKNKFIKVCLRQACEDLSARGLYLASKWAGELLVGMTSPSQPSSSPANDDGYNPSKNADMESESESESDESGSESESLEQAEAEAAMLYNRGPLQTAGSSSQKRSSSAQKAREREGDLIFFAQSLLLNGEYLRCAHMLRTAQQAAAKGKGVGEGKGKGKWKGKGPFLDAEGEREASGRRREKEKEKAADESSPLGTFLAMYSMYLAGEKLKDQQIAESAGQAERDALHAANAPNVAAGGAAAAAKSKPATAAAVLKSSFKNPFLLDLFRDLWPIYHRHYSPVTATTAAAATEASRSTKGKSQVSKGDMDPFLMYLLAVVLRELLAQTGGLTAVRQVLATSQQQGDAPLGSTAAASSSSSSSSRSRGGGSGALALPTVRGLLLASLRLYPWNWACWLDLSSHCVSAQSQSQSQSQSPPTWEQYFSACPAQCTSNSYCEAGHWVMYQHFLAHTHLEQQNGEAALGSINTLAEWLPYSQTVVTYRALAFYSLRDYDRAQLAFEAVRAVDPHRLSHVDTYSNILYVKEKRAELSHLAHMVTKLDKFAAETCCVVGNYYSLKGKHERAITYFQRALRANPKFLPAWTLMGHECVELRNTAAAVQCYRNAVDLSPTDYRAWYGLGQTYEMLHLYQYSLYYYKKATALKPGDARMWSAVGSQFVRLNCRKDAIMAFERALSSGDSEGVATRELARLYRDDGRLADAAQCYIRYLQNSGDHQLLTAALEAGEDGASGSAGEAGNTTTSASVGRQSNQSTLSVAVAFAAGGTANGMMPMDAERVEGALFLANFYVSKNELRKAEAFCALLVDFVGPEGDEARAIVRDIRSRMVARNSGGSGGSGSGQHQPFVNASRGVASAAAMGGSLNIRSAQITGATPGRAGGRGGAGAGAGGMFSHTSSPFSPYEDRSEGDIVGRLDGSQLLNDDSDD